MGLRFAGLWLVVGLIACVALPLQGRGTEEDYFRDEDGWFDRVYFDAGSVELTDAAREILDRQAEIIIYIFEHHDDYAVKLDGNTDSREVASSAESLALGERRAKAVLDYFVGMGIDAERMRVFSTGWYYPFAQGEDADSLAQNRVVWTFLL